MGKKKSAPRTLGEQLEAAILDNPDDLAAQAAYADWLGEQGDPRGELTAVQLALEEEGLTTERRDELRQREQELLQAHQAVWLGAWAPLAQTTGPEGRGQVDFPCPKFCFVRGILAKVALENLTLECARAFVRSPETRLVRELYLGGWAFEEPGDYDPGQDVPADDYDDPSRWVFPHWPYFSNLRVFQFGWTSNEDYHDFCHFQCHLRGDIAFDLVSKMPRLEELSLFADNVATDKLFALKTLDHLRILQVYHCWHYPLELLAANPALGQLTHLLLHPKAAGAWSADSPYIQFEGVQAVLHSPHLSSLTHLRLRLTDLGDRGCEEIVRSGILRRLKMLDLRHGIITDEGAYILAACPDVANLELLDLRQNRLTIQGIRTLLAVNPRVNLEHQYREGTHLEQYLFEGDYE